MARLRATGCVRQEFRSVPVSQLASFRALGPQIKAANQAAGKAKTQAGNQRALSPPSTPVFTMVTMRATKALMPAESSPVWTNRQSKESGLERIESPAMNIRRSPDMKKAARGKSRLFQTCLCQGLACTRRVIDAVNCACEERIEIAIALLG